MWYIATLLQNNLSLISKKFKYINLIFSAFVLVYLLQGTKTESILDYRVYKSQYELNSDYFENGYNVIVHIGNRLGLPYTTFRYVFGVLIVTIFLIGITRLTTEPTVAINGYMIASLIPDVVQIRQLAMLALVILGYSFLKKRSIASIFIGLFFLVLATQFHSLGLLFLLVLPLIKLRPQKQINLLKMCTVVFLALIAVFNVLPKGEMARIISVIMGIFSSRSNISANVLNVYSNAAGITLTVLTTGLTFLTIVILLRIPIQKLEESSNIRILFPSIYIMIVATFLTATMSIDFVRLLRASAVLIILLLSNLVYQNNVKQYYGIIISFGFISLYLQVGVVYQTMGKMIPSILRFFS